MHIKRSIGNSLVALGTVVGALLTGIAQAQTWAPVWADEFNWNGATDPNKWAYEVGGGGWGNNERQYYTNNRWENSRVELFSGSTNGRLIIEARKEAYGGSAYTSARLQSVPKWTYGRMEIRAKLPGGRGTWPAIWMLPAGQTYGTQYWPDNGEIDIMEQVGYDRDRIHGSTHSNWYYFKNNNQKTASILVSDPTVNWHTYALEWLPHEVRVSVDGNQYFTYTRTQAEWQAWPFDQLFGFRLNVAVGGDWGGAQGVDDSIFPRRMEIDYVRVFKPTSTSYFTTVPSLPGRVEAENYDKGGEGFAYHDTDVPNNGGAYRTDRVDIAPVTDGYASQSIGWIALGEWMNYTVNLTQTTNYGFTVRVASPNAGKKFYFEVDDKRATPDFIVPNTGGWNNWQTISWNRIPLPAGTHKIRLVALSDGFNVNWFDVWNAGQ